MTHLFVAASNNQAGAPPVCVFQVARIVVLTSFFVPKNVNIKLNGLLCVDQLLWKHFELFLLAVIFDLLRLQKYVGEKYGTFILASDFGSWFYI